MAHAARNAEEIGSCPGWSENVPVTGWTSPIALV